MSQPSLHPDRKFKVRKGNFDWSIIGNTSLDSVIETGRTSPLQSVLNNLTYSYIDKNDIDTLPEERMTMLFKLGSIAMESLTSGQQELQKQVREVQAQYQRAFNQQTHRSNATGQSQEKLDTLRRELRRKKKALQTYEYLIQQPAASEIIRKAMAKNNAFQCVLWNKFFKDQEFLDQHIARRHSGKTTSQKTGMNEQQVQKLLDQVQKQGEDKLNQQEIHRKHEMRLFKAQYKKEIKDLKESYEKSPPQKLQQSPEEAAQINVGIQKLAAENQQLRAELKTSTENYARQFEALQQKFEIAEKQPVQQTEINLEFQSSGRKAKGKSQNEAAPVIAVLAKKKPPIYKQNPPRHLQPSMSSQENEENTEIQAAPVLVQHSEIAQQTPPRNIQVSQHIEPTSASIAAPSPPKNLESSQVTSTPLRNQKASNEASHSLSPGRTSQAAATPHSPNQIESTSGNEEQPYEFYQDQIEIEANRLGIEDPFYNVVAMLSIAEDLPPPWMKTGNGTYMNPKTRIEQREHPGLEYYKRLYNRYKRKDDEFAEDLANFEEQIPKHAILSQIYNQAKGIPTIFEHDTEEVNQHNKDIKNWLAESMETPRTAGPRITEWQKQKSSSSVKPYIQKVRSETNLLVNPTKASPEEGKKMISAEEEKQSILRSPKLTRQYVIPTINKQQTGENLVPARFCNPARFKNRNGERKGLDMREALERKPASIENLYSFERPNFTFRYEEFDKRIDPEGSEVGEVTCRVGKNPDVEINYVEGAFTEFGINYLGRIEVTHLEGDTAKTFIIRLIGDLTYDPAGISNSQRRSEKVGSDYFSCQLGITLSQVLGYAFGCPEAFLFQVQQATLPAIKKYHRRFFLHDWMALQVLHACYWQNQCPPYAEYLLDRAKGGELRLDSDRRVHCIQYLEQYAEWKIDPAVNICAPPHFYGVIAAQFTPQNKFVTTYIGSDNFNYIVSYSKTASYTLMKVNAPILMGTYCKTLSDCIRKQKQQADMDDESSICADSMAKCLREAIRARNISQPTNVDNSSRVFDSVRAPSMLQSRDQTDRNDQTSSSEMDSPPQDRRTQRQPHATKETLGPFRRPDYT